MPSYRGELRLPNKHAIAATHQGADSNAALPRRGRGAANAEAWRGDDVASASCGAGRVDDVALRRRCRGLDRRPGRRRCGLVVRRGPPHHANLSPGLETALFYGLIMTRRAARLGLHRARNVERDDARDLARCALTNPGRDVCWSPGGRIRVRPSRCCSKLTWYLALGTRTRTSASQRL